MQSKRVARLAKQIRKRRARGIKWWDVCLDVKPQIVKADGATPDTGLAYQIAFNDKEPDREVQKRLGLPDVCIKCHRVFRKPSVRGKQDRSQARIWWNGLSHETQEHVLARLYRLKMML